MLRRAFLQKLLAGAAVAAAPKFIFDMGANLYKAETKTRLFEHWGNYEDNPYRANCLIVSSGHYEMLLGAVRIPVVLDRHCPPNEIHLLRIADMPRGSWEISKINT